MVRPPEAGHDLFEGTNHCLTTATMYINVYYIYIYIHVHITYMYIYIYVCVFMYTVYMHHVFIWRLKKPLALCWLVLH